MPHTQSMHAHAHRTEAKHALPDASNSDEYNSFSLFECVLIGWCVLSLSIPSPAATIACACCAHISVVSAAHPRRAAAAAAVLPRQPTTCRRSCRSCRCCCTTCGAVPCWVQSCSTPTTWTCCASGSSTPAGPTHSAQPCLPSWGWTRAADSRSCLCRRSRCSREGSSSSTTTRRSWSVRQAVQRGGHAALCALLCVVDSSDRWLLVRCVCLRVFASDLERLGRVRPSLRSLPLSVRIARASRDAVAPAPGRGARLRRGVFRRAVDARTPRSRAPGPPCVAGGGFPAAAIARPRAATAIAVQVLPHG